MKHLIVIALAMLPFLAFAQYDTKPGYCEEIPTGYGGNTNIGGSRKPLPKFNTEVIPLYKVQVALLKKTDPREFPFHPTLQARFRPCAQLWVIESKESYLNKEDAVALQKQLRAIGYSGAYIVELLGYE